MGITTLPSERQLKNLVSQYGLTIRNGIITSPTVTIEGTPAAIILVSNASKEVAFWLQEHARIKRHQDFRKSLEEILFSTFDQRLTRNAHVAGKRKQHTFANVIILPNNDQLIVDPVAREPSSINARVVSNLDVAQAQNPRIRQRLVYDDEEQWTPQDLGLLGIVGVPIIPFSRSRQAIEKLKASSIPSD